MDFDPEDQEIIRLLTKIKDAEGGYPEHMLVARRHGYLKRMGEISLGIPADMGVKNAAKDLLPTNVSSATSSLVETALVVAIIAEASAVAFFYRDQLADFFRRTLIEPRVQEVTPPPEVATSLEIYGISPSPAVTVTVPSAAMWSTPTFVVTPQPSVAADHMTGTAEVNVLNGTSVPGIAGDNVTSTAEENLVNATPGPNDSSENNGNNGNHYGQTPKPERTKENGNNPPPKDGNDEPPQDNNDKPPKEGPPPKEDKPPKEK